MLKRLSLGASISLVSAQALAWGPQGHTLVGKVGAELATDGQQFWQANADAIGSLSLVPDAVWKSLPTANLEKPTHYFQMDAYVSDPAQFPAALFSFIAAVSKQGQTFVTENGTAPWRADQMFSMAVNAFRTGDDANGLLFAGALSHYIGDLAMPLHVTKKYDGPEGEKTGIHKFFETDNLQSEDPQILENDVVARAQVLLTKGQIPKAYEGDFVAATFEEMTLTSTFVDVVLNTDSKQGRNGKGAQIQLDLAKDRMAEGSANLAATLSKVWRESGRSDVNKSVKAARKPSWVAIDYSKPSGIATTGDGLAPSSALSDCEM